MLRLSGRRPPSLGVHLEAQGTLDKSALHDIDCDVAWVDLDDIRVAFQVYVRRAPNMHLV